MTTFPPPLLAIGGNPTSERRAVPANQMTHLPSDSASLPSPLQELFDQIRAASPQAAKGLYTVFGNGLKFYLRRQLGPENVNQMVFSIFLDASRGVRQARVRRAEHLPRFINALARKQVALHGKTGDSVSTDRDRSAVETMKQVVSEMTGQEREILTRFYSLNQSEERIAAELKISRPAVLEVKRRARTRFEDLTFNNSHSRAAAVSKP